MDVSREPFGFLTYRGMDQMREVGKKFRRRYEQFGHRVGANNSNEERYSFFDHWDIQAYSTNYMRTVMSVQCFLDGLIGKCSQNQNKINAGGGLKQYYKDMGTYESLAYSGIRTTAEDMEMNSAGSTIRVQVRDKKVETLNAFDKHPKMMDELVKDVIATEKFQRVDGDAKPLADELCTYLPALRGAPQAFGGTPSKVNWVHANDHFVCRRAHGIPLAAKFSEEEVRNGKEKEAEAALSAMSRHVCSHLAWRFREWYRCPKLLSAVAAPPLREMMNSMVEAVHMGPGDRRPFTLYSCHDVTLLSFLYAIGADFLVNGEDCGGDNMQEEGEWDDLHSRKTWRWWPEYSSTIAFELVRMCDNQHVVRVVLNGDTLTYIPRMSVEDEGLLKEQSLSSRQVFGGKTGDDARSRMMTLSDFEQVIGVLESDGQDMVPFLEEDGGKPLRCKIGVDAG